jgi:hypothetical protein
MNNPVAVEISAMRSKGDTTLGRKLGGNAVFLLTSISDFPQIHRLKFIKKDFRFRVTVLNFLGT